MSRQHVHLGAPRPHNTTQRFPLLLSPDRRAFQPIVSHRIIDFNKTVDKQCFIVPRIRVVIRSSSLFPSLSASVKIFRLFTSLHVPHFAARSVRGMDPAETAADWRYGTPDNWRGDALGGHGST